MKKGREKREGPGEKKERKEGRDTGREGKIRETGKREVEGERGGGHCAPYLPEKRETLGEESVTLRNTDSALLRRAAGVLGDGSDPGVRGPTGLQS